jgi:hypothetical protein
LQEHNQPYAKGTFTAKRKTGWKPIRKSRFLVWHRIRAYGCVMDFDYGFSASSGEMAKLITAKHT